MPRQDIPRVQIDSTQTHTQLTFPDKVTHKHRTLRHRVFVFVRAFVLCVGAFVFCVFVLLARQTNELFFVAFTMSSTVRALRGAAVGRRSFSTVLPRITPRRPTEGGPGGRHSDAGVKVAIFGASGFLGRYVCSVLGTWAFSR